MANTCNIVLLISSIAYNFKRRRFGHTNRLSCFTSFNINSGENTKINNLFLDLVFWTKTWLATRFIINLSFGPQNKDELNAFPNLNSMMHGKALVFFFNLWKPPW